MSIVSPRRGRRRSGAPDTGPDPVDVHVGARMKLRRVLLGLSQAELGAALGLTFQQIQKYERAANRISASMLHHIATVLDVPVSFFFDGMDGVPSIAWPYDDGQGQGRASLELMRYFRDIPDDLRPSLHVLMKTMARHSW